MAHTHEMMYTQLFIAELFITAKDCKNWKRLLIEDWLKRCFIYIQSNMTYVENK